MCTFFNTSGTICNQIPFQCTLLFTSMPCFVEKCWRQNLFLIWTPQISLSILATWKPNTQHRIENHIQTLWIHHCEILHQPKPKKDLFNFVSLLWRPQALFQTKRTTSRLLNQKFCTCTKNLARNSLSMLPGDLYRRLVRVASKNNPYMRPVQFAPKLTFRTPLFSSSFRIFWRQRQERRVLCSVVLAWAHPNDITRTNKWAQSGKQDLHSFQIEKHWPSV